MKADVRRFFSLLVAGEVKAALREMEQPRLDH